jgi:hypothetical protein
MSFITENNLTLSNFTCNYLGLPLHFGKHLQNILVTHY